MKSGVKCFEMWWPGTELNRRRQPFQGCALPPELPGHVSSAACSRPARTLRFSPILAGRTTEAQRKACGTQSIITTVPVSLNVLRDKQQVLTGAKNCPNYVEAK